MKAAIVVEAGRDPVYGEFTKPSPSPGKSVIRVTASSLSHLARSRASGTHYSSDRTFPFIAGVDGTGVGEHGERVYFLLPERPYGAMAEYTIVDDRNWFAIPEALQADLAAAMAIPGMSSWAALVERARLRAGETVLINGATGTSGRLAIQVARHLGARKVIATGRHAASFEELGRLGADVTIALHENRVALEEAFSQVFRDGIDIVLDYVWGMSAEVLMIAAAKAGPEGVPIRYVQIGSISGASASLPGTALRSSALQLMGSGIGSVPFSGMLAAVRGVLEAAPSAGFTVATDPMPLSELARAWSAGETRSRIVLVP